MEFSTLCLNFNGDINFETREISYMNFLKLEYNEVISKEEICEIFKVNSFSEERLYIKNVQIVALYLTVKGTTFLVGIGSFFPDKWISSITVIKSLMQLKEELSKYYY